MFEKKPEDINSKNKELQKILMVACVLMLMIFFAAVSVLIKYKNPAANVDFNSSFLNSPSPSVAGDSNNEAILGGMPVDENRGYMPVNLPVKIDFPYIKAKLIDIKKSFSIEPSIDGQLDFDGKVLTLEHEKNLQYDTEYKVIIAKGLALGSEETMEEDFTFSFITKPRDTENLVVLHNYGFKNYTYNYYEADYELLISTDGSARGNYIFEVYQSDPEELFKVFSVLNNYENNDSDYNELIKINQIFQGKLVDSQTVILHKGAGAYIPKISLPGIYYIKVSDEGSSTIKSSFFITLTKNAVTTKRLGNKMVTWVVDQKTSEGVWGAEVITLGAKDGENFFQGKTDKRGIFTWKDTAKQPDILEVRVGKDTTFNFLNMGWNSSIYRDGYYGMNQNIISDYKAYIYTDRPVYRPGDKINFKAIVRENAEPFLKPAQKEFKITLQEVSYGEGGDTVFEKKISSNQKGALADFIEMSKEIKSGEYQISILNGSEILASSKLNIEFYQKPDFEISVLSESEKYIKGDLIKGEISSNYFFGEPVKGGEVAWRAFTYDGSTVAEGSGALGEDGKMKFELQTQNISLQSNDWYWWRQDGDSITLEAKITDQSGKESIGNKTVTIYNSDSKISLVEPKDLWNLKENNTYVFAVQFEDNIFGKPIINLPLKMIIKKYEWRYSNSNYKILKEIDAQSDTHGEIKFDYNFSGGGTYYFEISGVDARNNPIKETFYVWVNGKNSLDEETVSEKPRAKIYISTDKTSYKIGEAAQVTLQFPRPSGDVFWSANRDNFKRIEAVKITGQTQVINVIITESMVPGFYFYVNIFQDDSFLSETQLIEVSGKKLNIEIISSKEKLGPGEEVEILIKTKDENGNPVSAESSLGVVDKAIFALKSDQTANIYDSFYQLPDKEWLKTEESNGFVMTFAAEMGACFTAGTKILMADKSLKNIEIINVGDEILTKESDYSEKLVSDKVTKTFEHSVSEYLAIVHEKGVLKITSIHPILVNDVWKDAGEIKVGDMLLASDGEKSKVIFIEKVTMKEPIKVYNFQTEKYHTFFADGIYVHNQCGGKGEGDGCPVRSNFVDTAYWNAFVTTNAKGEAKVKFKLPDNLTTWMAVSKDVTLDTKVGQGVGEFMTSKDLIIRPVLPQFFRNGDEVILVGAVHNNLGKRSDFNVMLVAEGAEIVGQSLKNITVENGEINNISWGIKIGDINSAKLTFSAKDSKGEANDSVEISLPVYSNLSLVKKVISGTGEAKLDFSFEKKSSPIYNTATISLMPSVLAVLPEVIEKLSGYPYGCVEQTMSRHLPNILAYKEKSVLGLDPGKDFEKNITEGFDRLAKFQHSDGGFGWWETDENNVWVSGYVLEGLYEAKSADFLGGREEMYNRLREYLKTNVSKFSEEEQIYINYILSKIDKESVASGVEKFANMYLSGKSFDFQSHGYIALALQNIGDTIKAKAVLAKIMGEMTDNHWDVPDNFDYHGALKDKYSATGVNLLALVKINFNEKNASGIAQWLMNNRAGYEGLWGSTRQSSQILYALIEYLKKTSELKPNYVYDIYLNGNLLKSAKINNSRYSLKLDIPTEKIEMNNSLEIRQAGKGSIYWLVAMNNYVSGENISGEDSNLKITRKYFDINDNEISKIRKGDLVKVRLSVVNKEQLNYVAIEDFLPASFAVQNPRLENSVQENDQSRYYDYPYGSERYDSMDIRDQKITIFRRSLWPDTYNFEYLAIASYDGVFKAPAPRVDLMYSPEKFSFGSASVITVGR